MVWMVWTTNYGKNGNMHGKSGMKYGKSGKKYGKSGKMHKDCNSL